MNKKVVVLGFFDGLHSGHLSLINKALELKGEGYEPCAYLFDRHPLMVYNKKIELLMDFDKKVEAIRSAGIESIIVQKIDKEFLDMSPTEFARDILNKKLQASAVIVGENYTFGKNKSGNCKILERECKDLGIKMFCMPYTKKDGEIISSTYIRRLVETGKIKAANRLMIKNYEITGEVILGRQDGRKMGFPTANVLPPEDRVMPPNGVYATITTVDGMQYPSVTNVGVAPTFNMDRVIIETNIPCFSGDIYGEKITVEFLETLRFEKKFSSPQELKKQIDYDVKRRMNGEKCN